MTSAAADVTSIRGVNHARTSGNRTSVSEQKFGASDEPFKNFRKSGNSEIMLNICLFIHQCIEYIIINNLQDLLSLYQMSNIIERVTISVMRGEAIYNFIGRDN